MVQSWDTTKGGFVRTTLAVALTAVVCFMVGAASGLGGTIGRTYILKVKDIASLPSDNFN